MMADSTKPAASGLWQKLLGLLAILFLAGSIYLAFSARQKQILVYRNAQLGAFLSKFEMLAVEFHTLATQEQEQTTWQETYAEYIEQRRATQPDLLPSKPVIDALGQTDEVLKSIDDYKIANAGQPLTPELAENLNKTIGVLLSAIRHDEKSLFDISAAQTSRWTGITLLVLICCFLSTVVLVLLSLYQGQIAARMQMAQAVLEREARFESMVKHSSDIISLLKEDGTILYVSPSVVPILGYKQDELLGNNGFNYIHPEDRERMQHEFINAIGGSRSNGLHPYRAIDADGRWRWIESMATNMTNDPAINAIVINTRDVTDRKRYEQLLVDSNHKLTALINSSPSAIIAHDGSGSITIWNPAATRIFGWTGDEVLGKPDPTLVGGTLCSRLGEDSFDPAAATPYESIRQRIDGSRLPVSVSVGVLGEDQGSHSGLLWIIEDITERKRAEQSLIESENRLRTIIELEPECVKLVSSNGRMMHINPAGLQLVGAANPGQIVGNSVFGLVAPADRPRYAEMIKRVFEGESQSLEFEIISLRGERLSLDTRAVPILNSAGQVTTMLAVTRDVTERRVAEKALRASEERFSKAFNSGPRPLSIISLSSGRFITVNERFLEITGYSSEEVMGQTAAELRIWNSDKDRETFASAVAARRSIPDVEFSIKRKNGEVRHIQLSAEAIELDGDQCLLAAYEDITLRKQSQDEQARLQAAVQKSALEWRLTFDAVDSPILLLDAQGKIIRLNRSGRDLIGKSYWQVKGQPLRSITPRQPWQQAAEMAAQVHQSRGRTSCLVRAEDPRRTWDITASFFSGSGGDDRVAVVARDVTPTVELQESLRRSETMSAMGALVAGVAHEVRNPLFSISATIDAFDARFGEKEAHQRYITILRSEVERLNALMQELLEFGRRSTSDAIKESIAGVISQAIVSCGALAERSGVRIVNRTSQQLPQVMMDRGRMVQVFHNLIENAVQHSPPGASVTVETEEIRKNSSAWVRCTVSDTGPGFSESDLPKIFEPFFTRRRGGTGLGLSIVQRIVEEHGGKVFATNRTSGGAVLGVTLPIAKDDAQ